MVATPKENEILVEENIVSALFNMSHVTISFHGGILWIGAIEIRACQLCKASDETD